MSCHRLKTLAGVLCLGLVACAQPSSSPPVTAIISSSLPSPIAEGKQTTSTVISASGIVAATDSLRSTPTASAVPVGQPTRTPTPLACWRTGGHYEKGSLPDQRLKLPLEFSVYLPPCYDQQPERRYPVLYLIHGQNYNNDQWDRLGVDEAADKLVKAGEIPPFIIVLPRDRSWDQPTEDPFGQVLVDSLVPWVDANYRTLPERTFRAIGGLSRGAGWAIHLGLSQWELFDAIGGHSPPVFWADTPHIRAWLDAIPAGSMPRISLDIGEKDRPSIMESAIWFEHLLTEKGIPHVWHLYTGYHDETYWSAHVEEYLRWYAENWPVEK